MNYLFYCSNTALMSEWKSTIFELVITTLTSSAKGIGIEFPIKIFWQIVNLLTPNVNYSGRTAPLTSKVRFYIFIQQI